MIEIGTSEILTILGTFCGICGFLIKLFIHLYIRPLRTKITDLETLNEEIFSTLAEISEQNKEFRINYEKSSGECRTNIAKTYLSKDDFYHEVEILRKGHK